MCTGVQLASFASSGSILMRRTGPCAVNVLAVLGREDGLRTEDHLVVFGHLYEPFSLDLKKLVSWSLGKVILIHRLRATLE